MCEQQLDITLSIISHNSRDSAISVLNTVTHLSHCRQWFITHVAYCVLVVVGADSTVCRPATAAVTKATRKSERTSRDASMNDNKQTLPSGSSIYTQIHRHTDRHTQTDKETAMMASSQSQYAVSTVDTSIRVRTVRHMTSCYCTVTVLFRTVPLSVRPSVHTY